MFAHAIVKRIVADEIEDIAQRILADQFRDRISLDFDTGNPVIVGMKQAVVMRKGRKNDTIILNCGASE